MNPWINANILNIIHWSENLFTLILRSSIDSFKAGQFTKIALYDTNQKKIQRAYSYVNAPSNKNLEIYIARIPDGSLSNQLYFLKKNDLILIKKKSYGFFIIDEIPNCDILWMFSTGTGIGPYLSILQENKNLEKFKYIILVHSVRYQKELNYLPLMKDLYHKYNGKLKIQTIVSREKNTKSLTGRIPDLLKNNTLENSIGLNINNKNSHVMLCGNPNMVKDTVLLLKNDRNMKKNLRRSPGHITIENYW